MTDQFQTILPPDMHGVMFISGYRGFGKTFLASQSDLPQNITFFDFEDKGEGVDSQLHFGDYRALTQESGGDPIALYNISMNAFNAIENKSRTVVILDNISPLESAMNAEAAHNAQKYADLYGLNYNNIKNNRYGGTKAIVNFMISDISSKLHAKGVHLVIATSHIKPRWIGGAPAPNKFNIKGGDKWQELSILTLILIPGVNPPIPSALVQKEQLGTIGVPSQITPEMLEAMQRGEKGHTVSRRLPPKIGECTFQKIRWYLHNPVQFNELKEDERPSFDESDPFDEKLNKEQFAVIRMMLEQEERERAEEEAMLVVQEELAKQQRIDGLVAQIEQLLIEDITLTPQQLLERINSNGMQYTMPEVAQAKLRVKRSD